MARGYLSGAIWGTVLSVAGLGTLSVLSPTLTDPQPSATDAALPTSEMQAEPDAAPATNTTATSAPAEETAPAEAPEPVPAETAATDAAGEQPAPQPETQPEPAPETAPAPVTEPTSQPGRRPIDVTAVTPEIGAPGLAAPGAGADTAPDNSAMVPTPVPETGAGVAKLTAPEGQDAPGVSVEAGSPAPLPTAPAPTLTAPQGELGLAVSTEPAQPPAPPVPDVQTALVPDPAPEVDEPLVIAEPEAEPEVTLPEDDTAPQKPAVRRLVPDTPAPDASQSTDTAALARPAIGKPASSLVNRPGESNSSRLPSIGDAADPAENDAAAGDGAVPPLKRFAAPVEADASLPRMAIVLIDDMTGPLGPDTLDNFPFAVTFALDPAKPGAADRMAAYRSKGFEVATLTRLPEAATPSDVEQLLAGAVAALPESVALIEAPGSALQGSRSSTEQLARFAAESGHGLVFLPNGLNTAEAMARRENIAAVSVLRDFDGEAQDARTKRRFLDGGAFRARQDGAVVMLGRLTPDTLSALVLWSLQDRASSVAMVPVSNILIDSLE